MSIKLTHRQLEVLRLLAMGATNAQIAMSLNITLRTVKYHTASIYSKIGVHTRVEAIAWAWKNKIIR